ncbi:MAG: bifunctional 4-hydroxy-2-oxoglutarate aldolase/2-dehydro-3-deoxy-phosphogluconate aldolase [Candidatus Hydrogenedentota bacterium]
MTDASAAVERIVSEKIVAIVRLDSSEALSKVADALIEGGLSVIEFTMTTPGALGAIERARGDLGDAILIGAGTVLDAATASDVIRAGAQFVVSPALDRRVIDVVRERGVAAIPGAYTPTEIVQACEWGADIVKLFPASTLGPGYLKALRGPLPNVRILPTGGVTIENARGFLDAGAVALAIGGELVNNALVNAGNFGEITKRARAFRELV